MDLRTISTPNTYGDDSNYTDADDDSDNAPFLTEMRFPSRSDVEADPDAA